jgi:hypothetical protein
MSNSGATSALRGYRLQFLYILNEMLTSGNSELSFAPEDEEDLSIYKDGERIRIIQVKAYSNNLTLSKLATVEESKSDNSKKPKDSFFRRVHGYLKNVDGIQPAIEVASFGNIGRELGIAWNKNSTNLKEIAAKQQNVLSKLKNNYRLKFKKDIFELITVTYFSR